MKPLLLLLLSLAATQAAQVQWVTNQTADGRIWLTTIYYPEARRPAPEPPLVPGMKFRLLNGGATRANSAIAPAVRTKTVEVPHIETLLRQTNANRRVLVGPDIKPLRRPRVAARVAARVSGPPGPPVEVVFAFHQPVAYPSPYPPYYVVIDSTTQNASTTALANHRCELQAGGDLMGWGVFGEFGAGPADRRVEVNRIDPTETAPVQIYWRGANFPEP